MAVSITQRPASWVPVNNPVIYKFSTTSGPFTNYRIEIEVFAGGVSVGSIFSFTPNSSNVTTANISAILKSILYREWSLPSGINDTEDNIVSTDFYIKYQELYTGSATSQISDSGNTKIGVLSALQIGSSADLTDYVPSSSSKKFLTKFDDLKMWDGYPFTLSILFPTMGIIYSETQYDINGTILKRLDTTLNTSYQGALNRIKVNSIEPTTEYISINLIDSYTGVYTFNNPSNNTFTGSISPWVNEGSGQNWSYNANTVFCSAASKLLANSIAVISGQIRVVINCRSVLSDNISVSAWGSFKGGAYTQIGATTNFNNAVFQDKTFTATISGSYDRIAFRITQSGGGPSGWLCEVKYITVEVSATSVVSETRTIQVETACRNPVYLIWKNSLGGDTEWLFDWIQEYTHNYSDGKKCKRLVLYADGLSFNEFEAIDELNTPGEIVDVPIIELTTSVNKTSKKTDQQVYVVQTDGSKVGVVVITNPARTQTKRRQHFIEIEIEFPETFL